MNNVANPSDFAGVSIQNEVITKLVSTFQMTKYLVLQSIKLKSLLMFVCFDLAPRMAIALLVHSLHLARMAIWIIN
jgi:hypothetical protein